MKTVTHESEISQTGWALLDIATSWCNYCASTSKAIREVTGDFPQVEFCLLDGDEDPDALMRFKASTYPTLVLHYNGVEVARRPSAKVDDLHDWLTKNIKPTSGLPRMPGH